MSVIGEKPLGASGVTASEDDSVMAQRAYRSAPPDVQQLFVRAGGGEEPSAVSATAEGRPRVEQGPYDCYVRLGDLTKIYVSGIEA